MNYADELYNYPMSQSKMYHTTDGVQTAAKGLKKKTWYLESVTKWRTELKTPSDIKTMRTNDRLIVTGMPGKERLRCVLSFSDRVSQNQ